MKKFNSPKTEKYVTISVFERAMASIARSFTRIEERFDKIDRRFDKIDQKFEKIDKKLLQHDNAFDTLIKMYQGYQEQMREHRERMFSLESNDIRQEKAIDVLNKEVGIITIK